MNGSTMLDCATRTVARKRRRTLVSSSHAYRNRTRTAGAATGVSRSSARGRRKVYVRADTAPKRRVRGGPQTTSGHGGGQSGNTRPARGGPRSAASARRRVPEQMPPVPQDPLHLLPDEQSSPGWLNPIECRTRKWQGRAGSANRRGPSKDGAWACRLARDRWGSSRSFFYSALTGNTHRDIVNSCAPTEECTTGATSRHSSSPSSSEDGRGRALQRAGCALRNRWCSRLFSDADPIACGRP